MNRLLAVDRSRLGWLAAALAAGIFAGVTAAGASRPELLAGAVVAVVMAAAVLVRYEIGAVLMVATLPLDEYGRVISAPVTVTLFHLALLLTLASFALAQLWRSDFELRFSAVDVGIAALIGAALWSLPGSLAPRATVVAIVRLVALWAFTLLYANALSQRKVADWVTWALIGTGVASSLLAVVQYAVPGFAFGSIRMINEGGGSYLRRVGALFHDPNFLATFLTVALIAAGALLVHERTWRKAVLWGGASLVLLVGIAVTFSRTAIVGLGVGAITLVLTAPKDRRTWLLVTGAALVLAVLVVAPGQVTERVASIGEVGYNNSNATRYYMLGSTVEIMRDEWVHGTGLAAFDRAYPRYRRLGSLSTILKPHQLPLAMVAEMGVAGLIAEIVLVGSIVAVMWRHRPKGWSAYEAFAAAGLVALLAQALFQYYLYFEYLWLLVAFAVAAPRLAAEEESV